MSRVLPQDLDAEGAILSTLLVEGCTGADPRDRWQDVSEALTPDMFLNDANGVVFRGLSEIFAEGGQPDIVRLVTWLRARDLYQRAGGRDYLEKLVRDAPAVTDSNLARYVDGVLNAWRKRQVMRISQRLQAEVPGDVGDLDQWIDQAARELSKIAAGGSGAGHYRHIGELLTEAERRNTEARMASRLPLRFPTGIADLDDVVRLRPGQLVIVGAPSGVGKAALVGGIARHVAGFDAWEPEQRLASPGERPHVLFFELEMEDVDICERIWCGGAQVSQRAWETHRLDAEGYDRMASMASWLKNTGLYIGYRPRLTMAELKRNIRAAAAEARGTHHGNGTYGRLRMVVLDYLGLMDIPVAKGERFDQAVGKVVWEMKQIAEEEQLCFVCISQLNRMYAQRKDGRPTMADLRDSGQIEHHADTVLFVYREDLLDHASDMKGFGEIIVAKQRKGQSSTTVNVRWRPEYTAYEGLSMEDRYRIGEVLEARRAKAKGGKR